MKVIASVIALVFMVFAYTGCNNGGGHIEGKVYFETSLPDPIPAAGVTVTVSAYIDNTQYSFSGTSNAAGKYRVTDIEPAGQYGIIADFETADNIPEDFDPVGGEVGDNYTEPIGTGYQLQYGPVDIKVGSHPTFIEDLDFSLISF